MDVVYLCRPGRNEELRFSLRSLRNIPHDRVWIFGGAPDWVTVPVFPVSRHTGASYATTTEALLAAAHHPEVSDRFLLMNDDFFIMAPIGSMPTLHRGRVQAAATDYQRRGVTGYAGALVAMGEWLADHGHPDPLCYELHVPMVMDKATVRELPGLGIGGKPFDMHKRTLYGNHAHIGGSLYRDAKVIRGDADRLFLSTTDQSFHSFAVGKRIRRAFPDPSPYERAVSDADPSDRRIPRRHVPLEGHDLAATGGG